MVGGDAPWAELVRVVPPTVRGARVAQVLPRREWHDKVAVWRLEVAEKPRTRIVKREREADADGAALLLGRRTSASASATSATSTAFSSTFEELR